MKKTLLTIFFLSILSVSIITGGIAALTRGFSKTSIAPRQTARVNIEPQNGTANVGEQYTINVTIADVTNLYGFDIQIRWGTAVLKYSSHTTYAGQPGGVLNPPIFTIINEVSETSGPFSRPGVKAGTTYWFSVLTLGGAPFNGTGIVFTMTFDVVRDGECDIYFTNIDLTDNASPGAPIPFLQEDSYFYRPGSGQVPVADFTVFPNPAVQTKITAFDASASYDPDTGGDISLYLWNFQDGTIENTTSAAINHTFATLPVAGFYSVELTVLDDQDGGSQSKPKTLQVPIVHPKPVAHFSVWPEDHIAVVDKTVTFNASESFDPDPGGTIVEYRWSFGDGNSTNTTSPIITHKFQALNPTGYSVELTVVDDSDGLESDIELQLVMVVQRRDIEVTSVAASPAEVRQGEDVTIDVTIANKGEAEESFNIAAYYNTTMTNWIKVDEQPVSDFPAQSLPEWEFAYGLSLNSTVNHILKDLVGAGTALRDDTTVRVGTDTGYWTLNPGLLNTNTSQLTLVSGTPLTTGGWIWEKTGSGPKKLNGEFAAGDWAFKFKLYATQAGVNGTVWTRILKSDNPDPHGVGALVTVIKDWTSLFPAVEITNTTADSLTFPNYNGNVSVPFTTFTDEYLFFEFQLQVTANTAGNSTTNVVFQVGGTANVRKSRITGTTFSSRNTYTLSWKTQRAEVGLWFIKVNTTRVPHETNLTNNEGFSTAINVTAGAPIEPLDVSLDVGTVYFRGETAEFHVLITDLGDRVDADLNASMLFNRSLTEINSTFIEHIAEGIYMITYPIETDAPSGTYTLVVDASRLIAERNATQTGSTLKSFLVSEKFTDWDTTFIGWDETFTRWNTILTEIRGNTATIITVINDHAREIKVNLTAINASLSGLVVGAKNETLAKIDTALGPVVADLGTINARVATIQGDTATIRSSLGDVNVSIGVLQSTITMGLTATSILSAVAAIIAVLIWLRLRKLGK